MFVYVSQDTGSDSYLYLHSEANPAHHKVVMHSTIADLTDANLLNLITDLTFTDIYRPYDLSIHLRELSKITITFRS